jgi:type II secretory pathway pseudopilin PulG
VLESDRGRGFTYLGLMFIVVVLSMTATMASVVWSTVQQRANEQELLFIGRQFQAAIERYGQRNVGTEGRYPRRLEELLRDARTIQIERHLRRLYIDPMTGQAEWGLLRLADGGIVGVHSLSSRAPMEAGVAAAALGFSQATSYRDWRFVAPSAVELLTPVPLQTPP